jgi:hypothetical protein
MWLKCLTIKRFSLNLVGRKMEKGGKRNSDTRLCSEALIVVDSIRKRVTSGKHVI